MAAQAWKVYNWAKKCIGNGTLKLDGTVFRLSLAQSASNFATLTLKTHASLTNEVASAGGYALSGSRLTSTTWTTGASAKQWKFDSTAWGPLTASGADIANIKAAVIWQSGASAGSRLLLCFASLTGSQFTLATGNTITITPASGGILTLT
jgi:hypothetical protein